ncbi:MAG: tryptophan synthase subunit beta [Rhodobacteraceae bacterium]|nr:tryptophan synthase subunit beta [Paracoccaceae bacterium]
MKPKNRQRIERQLQALTKALPFLGRLRGAHSDRFGMLWRVPLGLFFVAGGFLAILPVFGLWMIPLGLLLLAVDLPPLRPVVAVPLIRLRRKWALWRRANR